MGLESVYLWTHTENWNKLKFKSAKKVGQNIVYENLYYVFLYFIQM